MADRRIHECEPWYEVLQIAAIIFFAYFYISIVFRPDDIADNMRKYGGFIPGIRPGKRTADFINDVLTRITLVGALYLVVITIIPTNHSQSCSRRGPGDACSRPVNRGQMS